MSQETAAGRKTDTATPRPRHSAGRIEAQLAEQMELLTAGMRHVLERAASIPFDYDQYGHTRSAEFSSAIALAKVSAEVVLAMAKLDGHFNHNIRVERIAAEEGGPPSQS